MNRFLIILLSIIILNGCSSMKIEDYAGTQPEFKIEEYFKGKTRAWGIFQDRSGAVKRQFTVDLTGEVNGDTLVLTEDFVYTDGEESQRIWTIKKIDDHTYEGTAPDVDGVAIGKAYGNALYWNYVLKLPVGDSVYNVKFNDWMFLQPDGVLLNKAEMSKFGINVGEVTLSFKKEN